MLLHSQIQLLESGLSELGLLEVPSIVHRLSSYLEEILTWNDRFGLVSFKSTEELIVRHVFDALAPIDAVRALNPSSIADLGSGAGFPGIPLALAMPNVSTTLVERMAKRCSFLEGTVAVLGRDDIAVVSKPFEEVEGRFDVLTFRAFSPLDRVLVSSLGKLGSTIVAYKGKKDVIAAELDALKTLDVRTEVYPVSVPYLKEERHLVVVRFN